MSSLLGVTVKINVNNFLFWSWYFMIWFKLVKIV
jgi:hypothetical protein